ncbi:MAG: 4Fe-4S binding protein [Promethearchaeota archaeon]
MEESLVLNEDEKKIYQKLQQHLDELPIGYPPTRSGVELKLLTYYFTPEEAKIATRLKYSFETLDEIYENIKDLGIGKKNLEISLDDMVKKGSLYFKVENGRKYYRNDILVLGMYEHKVNDLTKDFLDTFNQYLIEAFAQEFLSTNISQFRILPVEKSLTPEHHIPTYDELVKIIEDLEGSISVQNCICRQANDLLGNPCKQTDLRENCMCFGEMAELYIHNKWGREINKNEALEILRNNQEDGLVFEAGNALSPHFICSCCGCCCGVLQFLRLMPNTAELLPSNHFAEVDLELCAGCGTCAERCQVNAIKITNEKSNIDVRKCIGCGNCVVTCPEEALYLVKKEEEFYPPSTPEELYEKILAKKIEMKSQK